MQGPSIFISLTETTRKINATRGFDTIAKQLKTVQEHSQARVCQSGKERISPKVTALAGKRRKEQQYVLFGEGGLRLSYRAVFDLSI